MSEVKREFWISVIDYDARTNILDAHVVDSEPQLAEKEHHDFIHVVSMDWHEQEMERVKKRMAPAKTLELLMADNGQICELHDEVEALEAKVQSLTAMLEKMEKALGFYGASAGTWFSMTDGGKQYVCIDVSDHEYRPNNEMMIKYAGLKAREALKELADFRGSK